MKTRKARSRPGEDPAVEERAESEVQIIGDGAVIQDELLDEIQKSIYIALESADTATDAVRELVRLKSDVIERAERISLNNLATHRRALWIIAPLCALACLLAVVGTSMLLSTRSDFARIAEVSKEGLKTYIADINTLTKQLEGLTATRQQLEGLATAISSQQLDAGQALGLQREMFETLRRDMSSHQNAVTDLLSRGQDTSARNARSVAPPPATGGAAMTRLGEEVAAVNQRLRVIQQLIERAPRAAASGAAPDPQLARGQAEILSALRDLQKNQALLAEQIQRAKSAPLVYP